jgi:uncharacterized protein (DUF1015 family)
MIQISPFKAVLPNQKLITAPDSFFGQVKNQYTTLLKAGYFVPNSVAALFVYQIASADGVHTGLLCGLDIDGYLKGSVLKHEQTIAVKEEKTLQLLNERAAMIKPVLLAHKNVVELKTVFNRVVQTKSVFSIELRKVKHTVWQVTDAEDIATLQAIYAEKVDLLYIADGHHRMAAAARLFQQNPAQRTVLTALFAADELKIYDYNRVVEDTNGLTALNFIAKISQYCTLEPVVKPTYPRHKHEFAIAVEGHWFLAAWRNEVIESATEPQDTLDVSMLNAKVLTEIFDIKDIRTDVRVTYWEGVKGLEILSNRSRNLTVGFGMYPVDIADLMRIAEANGSMPPKSTWFEPRIKNGLVIMPL